MAKIEIASAWVEEQVGNPTFVLKIAEPHSRKDEQGKWQTVARTFFDVKVGRESGIDLARFVKGSRVKVAGTQRTEVREHEGKKYYTLLLWADSIELIEAGSSQGAGFGGGSRVSGTGGGAANSDAPNGGFSQPAGNGFGNDFGSEPF